MSDAMPTSLGHEWRYIGFGPDDKLYIPVGAPCNICRLTTYEPIEYGSINRMNPGQCYCSILCFLVVTFV